MAPCTGLRPTICGDVSMCSWLEEEEEAEAGLASLQAVVSSWWGTGAASFISV